MGCFVGNGAKASRDKAPKKKKKTKAELKIIAIKAKKHAELMMAPKPPKASETKDKEKSSDPPRHIHQGMSSDARNTEPPPPPPPLPSEVLRDLVAVVVSPKPACSVAPAVTLIVSAVFLVLFVNGHLHAALEALGEIGVAGWLVFVVLVTQSGLPLGVGYTALIVAAGYSLGWFYGLACVEMGAALGASSGFLVSKKFLSAQVLQRQRALTDADRLRLKDLWAGSDIKQPQTQAFSVIFLLLNNAILSFGVVGTICAVTGCEFTLFLLCTAVCIQPHALFHVGIGVLIRRMWEAEEKGVDVNDVILEGLCIVCSLVLLIATTWYAFKVLPFRSLVMLARGGPPHLQQPEHSPPVPPQPPEEPKQPEAPAGPLQQWRVTSTTGVRVRREKDLTSHVVDVLPNEFVVRGCIEDSDSKSPDGYMGDPVSWVRLHDGRGYINFGTDSADLKPVPVIEEPRKSTPITAVPVLEEFLLSKAPLEVAILADPNSPTFTFGMLPDMPNLSWGSSVKVDRDGRPNIVSLDTSIVSLDTGAGTGSGEARHLPKMTLIGRARSPRAGVSSLNGSHRTRLWLQATSPQHSHGIAAELLEQLAFVEAAEAAQQEALEKSQVLCGPFCQPVQPSLRRAPEGLDEARGCLRQNAVGHDESQPWRLSDAV